MIIPDINLLIYAHDAEAPHHTAARAWWEDSVNGREPIGLPCVVITGFIRLMTHPKVMRAPASPQQACAVIDDWLAQPRVRVLDPGPRYFAVFSGLLAQIGVAAGLTTDAHLAALAIEHAATLCSNDRDFARFAGLTWRNPLL